MVEDKSGKDLKCNNCIVCVQGTEMCPLEDNYNEDYYLIIEEKLKKNKEEKNKSQS